MVAPAVKPLGSDRANAVKEQCFTAVASWLGASRYELSMGCSCRSQPAWSNRTEPSAVVLRRQVEGQTAEPEMSPSQHRSASFIFICEIGVCCRSSADICHHHKAVQSAKPTVPACRTFMVHLLPILLLGLTDEGQGIREATVACLNQVAEKHKAVQESSAANQVSLLTLCL